MKPSTTFVTAVLTFIITSCLVVLVWMYRQPMAAYVFAVHPSPAVQPPSAQARYGTEIELRADSNGHFFLDAIVDRTHFTFMIDTGASITVLSADDAAKLGLSATTARAFVNVQTGGGMVKMARVTLPYLESGHLRIDGLEALIAPDNGMRQSVLGMNFLNRLTSYQVEQRRMILVP